MISVAFYLLLAKAIAFGKEMLVAYHYGTSAVVDGYLFVFNLAQWPSGIFASVTAFILIPYLVRLQKSDPAEAGRLQAALLAWALWAGALISLLFGFVAWWMLSHIPVGLTAEGLSAALSALPWVAPTIAFAFLCAVFSNWLMSQRRHANTLLEAVPAATIAGCVLLWPIATGRPWDALPLAIGTLIGFAVQSILLSILCRQGVGFAHAGVIARHGRALRGAFGIMLVAQVVISSTVLLDQFFAVRMGEGVLASYSYAQRIMSLVLGLTSIVVGRAMLPILSGSVDRRAGFALATRWAGWFFGLGLLCAAALFFIAEHGVMLLFQRGAFTQGDTQEVAGTLALLGLQLPFYLAGIVLVQWVAAADQGTLWLIAALSGLLAKLGGTFLWFDHGAQGLAASTALMYCTSTIVIYGHKSLAKRY